MYLCARGVFFIILILSTILMFDLGAVPTVWYFLFFILSHTSSYEQYDIMRPISTLQLLP
jgi:hypothetical protein